MAKTYSRREMCSLLTRNGWREVRTNGSHTEFKNVNYPEVIVINLRPNCMVCQRIIKTYNLK